jgi:hypothetical protein
MKVKIWSFFLILQFIQFQNLQAQDIYYLNKKILETLDNISLKKSTEPLSFDYEGSPYNKDIFVKGDIYFDINQRFPNIPLRYNIFNDEMEFKIEGQETIYAIKPDKRIQKIIIQEDTFVVAEYEEKTKIIPGFFKLLATGEIDLLAKYQVDFKEEQPAKALVLPEPAKFIRKEDQYYIKIKEGITQKISNIKKLIELIGNHKNELNDYTKKEKISARNESELIQFISFYNSL